MGLWNYPACFFEAHVFADPQLTTFEFEKIAHEKRGFRSAEPSPGGVLVLRLDLARRVVVLRPGVRCAGYVWRPAKLLARVVLHSVNAETRHESPIVVDAREGEKPIAAPTGP